MRIHSTIHHNMLATGLVLALSAVPFSQVMAQDAAPMQKSSANQTVPDKAADAWITTKVKSEFGTTKGIKAMDISVSTTDGVVTLTGTVGSQDEKMHAEHVAQLVKGVKSVDVSHLAVGGMSSEQQ